MALEKDLFKLTSIDDTGARLNIIPAEVKGFFRKQRTWVHSILLIIFLLAPWLHLGGKQLVFLNIPERVFVLFGLTFKAHDAPLIFLVLITAVIGIAFVTSVWGRAWCGWACPQTVFIDLIYRRIEMWTEGNYLERRKLRQADFSLVKFRKVSAKWSLFLLVSFIFSHSFAAYFVGSHKLLGMMSGAPSANWSYFLIIAAITALILFDFAWFREQFCVIMCPYGRLQSVLLEPSSLAIVYDQQRGEPRRGREPVSGLQSGDCISCNRCVEVCPTGIDIRNGLQMECINCTACIDACDEIMSKVQKPCGLIRYQTLSGEKFRVWKLKTYAFAGLIVMAIALLTYNVAAREKIEISILRGIDTPYTEVKDQEGHTQIINHFRLHIISQSDNDISYEIGLAAEDKARGLILTVPSSNHVLKSGRDNTLHFFVRGPKKLFEEKHVDFAVEINTTDGLKYVRRTKLVGP